MTILALSVADRIEQYGAYAGFAAVVGLALLSLLLFAQAREVKRLREWAGRAPERAAELEERIAGEAQKRVVAQPVKQPAPTPSPAAAARPAAVPATPAAQAAKPGGAPATPAGAPATPGGAPPVPAVPGNGAPAKDGEAAAGEKVDGEKPPGDGKKAADEAGAAAQAGDARATGTGEVAAPGEVPAAAAGEAAASAKPPAPATPAAAGTAPGQPGASTPPPVPAAPLRAPAPSASVPARTPAGARAGAARTTTRRDSEGSPARQTIAIVGAVTVVLAALIFVGFQVFGGDEEAEPPNAIGTQSAAVPPAGEGDTTPAGGSAGAVARGDVSLAVLNGTTFVGLARSVAEKLAASGFDKTPTAVTNAAEQTRSATIVEFAPGHRDEAFEIAKVIKVGRDAVQPMSEATRVIAGQGAEVVVTVGADQTPQQ